MTKEELAQKLTKSQLAEKLNKANQLIEELESALGHMLKEGYLDPRLMSVLHANQALDKSKLR